MRKVCQAPRCGSSASHQVAVRAGADAAGEETVLLCPSHAGTLRFTLVAEVLSAVGLELLRVSVLRDG